MPLWQHMDDAAGVAGEIFDTWVPPLARATIAQPFGGDHDAARVAVTFLAGVHDVGKATPAFAVQDPVLAARMREHGLAMPPNKDQLPDRRRVHHSLAGHHLLRSWLINHDWSPRTVSGWAVIVGGHHGVPPEPWTVNEGCPRDYPDLYGEGLWVQVQQELIDRMATRTGALARLQSWRPVLLTPAFQVLVSGLVIMADWIASDQTLLPFHREDLPEVAQDRTRTTLALSRLALPPSWSQPNTPSSVEELFSTRFNLPPAARPRPVQHAAHDVAEHMETTGMMVIEAPMGEGKTEAALAAAEVLARRWGCGGVFVALPTQATTDAMFARVVEWLDAMGSAGEPVGAITLSHGKASLNRLFQGIARAGAPTQIGCDEDNSEGAGGCDHAVVAHAWLSGRKKAQLANFVVGTIDKLLFAGLKARHLMLRHLAVAGKVVVIDEVHAYDAFMNSYLMKVLSWLGAYGVPVVALSATLPAERREALLNAYNRQNRSAQPPEEPAASGYPMISWTVDRAVAMREIPPSGRQTIVAVEPLGGGINDDLGRLVALLEDLLSDGGCAVVVRNTVPRVLSTARILERVFPGEVTVAHSRFITADRLRKDDRLLRWFGPPRRGTERPARRIVVASQVIEQSLDVDFDVLVTDLAPVDLVLQRMGRLHRHDRGADQQDRPAKLRDARIFLAGAHFQDGPPQLEPAAADYVYHRFPLLRSAAVLQPRFGKTLNLPDDIAPLVADAYGEEQVGPLSWQETLETQRQRWQRSIEERTSKARTFQIDDPGIDGDAILGWVSGSVGEADDDAQGQGQVRDGAPSLETILVQQNSAGEWRTPSWLPPGQSGLLVATDRPPDRTVASVLIECTLRLPISLSDKDTEDSLRAGTPPAWRQSKMIYRLPALVVDSDGLGWVGDRPVRYTPDTGLEVLKAAST
jgi:CRISPR-associated endonuclease/helicase Cas3